MRLCKPFTDFWAIFPILLTILSFGIVLSGFLNGVKNIIPAVLYLPIILIAYRHPKCGIQCSFLVGILYLLGHLIYFPDPAEIPVAIITAIVLTGIGTLISIFSYRLNVKISNLSRICDASGAGIFLLKRDGRIMRVNDHFLSMLGYQNRTELDHLDQIWEDEKATEIFDLTTKYGKNQDIETIFRCRDGTLLPVLITAGPAHDEQIVCTVVDISRIKMAEREQQE